jgi:hypothetical protein
MPYTATVTGKVANHICYIQLLYTGGQVKSWNYKLAYKQCWVLTVLGWGARVCLLITMVVVFRSVLGPPGDFGTSISVGLEGLFTNSSAALTTSNTYRYL